MTSRWIKLVAAMCVSAALVLWAFWRADVEAILRTYAKADLRWVMLALGALLTAFLLHCTRWLILIAAVGRRPAFFTLVPVHFAGLLANLFLPAQLGLDAVRVQFGRRYVDSRSDMLAIVMADRVVGAWAVSAVATVTSLILISRHVPRLVLPVGPCIFAGATLVAAIVVYPHPATVERWLHRFRVPLVVQGVLLRVLATSRTFVGRKRRLALAAVIAGVQAILMGVAVGCLGKSMALTEGERISFLTLVMMLPIIALVTMVAPFTISGIGLREAMFVWITLPLGLDKAQALALATTWFGLTIIASLPGVFGWITLSQTRTDSRADQA